MLFPIPARVTAILQEHERLMRCIAEACKGTGISLSAGLMMAFLGDDTANPATLMKIKYFLGTNPHYTLQALAKKGYVHIRRDAQDRRKVMVALLPRGLALAERIRAALVSEFPGDHDAPHFESPSGKPKNGHVTHRSGTYESHS